MNALFDRLGDIDWCAVLSPVGHRWCRRRGCQCTCHTQDKAPERVPWLRIPGLRL